MAKARLEDFGGAFSDYDRALVLDRHHKAAWFNRAHTKQRIGEFASAIVDYNEALELDRYWPHAYFNRGVCKQNLGDYTGALADYARAAKVGDHNNNSHNRVQGSQLLRQGWRSSQVLSPKDGDASDRKIH